MSVIGFISGGLYWRNRVDNEESEASFSFNPSIKVLTMYYYNSGTRPEITARNRDLISSLSDATKYKGYKSPNASRLINYISEGELNFDKPVPPSSQFFSSNGPFADHFNMLRNDINVCDYVDNRGVREIWIWMIHIPGQIVPNESNMSMGNSIRSKWNFSNYGDISNSYRSNDLPICNSTYTVYNYNMDRGLGTMIENHTHQIEHVLNFIDGRDVTPQNQWQNLLFWGKFVGSEANHKIINPGCGWTHYPPNGQSDYDWRNTTTVLSDCENWLPDGGGQKVVYNCLNLANGVCPNDEGVTFKIWWMQNIPGNNHNLFYSGKKLTNWWGFFSDFDYMMNNNLKLVEANPSNPLPNQAPVVNAGVDQSITLPSGVSLNGTVTDDGLPNPPAALSYTWSKVSGPGAVTLGNGSIVDTTASFSTPGVYTLRLTSSDSLLSSSDEVVITVNEAPPAGTVSSPILNPNGGIFTNSVSVSISTPTAGAVVRYTTNGIEPTSSSTLYTTPITLTETTTIKAKGFKDGSTPSVTAEATFTKNAGVTEYSVVGNITFKYNNIPIEVVIKNGSTIVKTVNINGISSENRIEFRLQSSEIPPGNYNILIKPRYYTSREGTLTLGTNQNITFNVVGDYYGGKYSNTNPTKVTILDISLFLSYFRAHDHTKDLNGDSRLNLLDLVLLLNSFRSSI